MELQKGYADKTNILLRGSGFQNRELIWYLNHVMQRKAQKLNDLRELNINE